MNENNLNNTSQSTDTIQTNSQVNPIPNQTQVITNNVQTMQQANNTQTRSIQSVTSVSPNPTIQQSSQPISTEQSIPNQVQQQTQPNNIVQSSQPVQDTSINKKTKNKKPIILVIIAIIVIVIVVLLVKNLLGGSSIKLSGKNIKNTYSTDSYIAVKKDGKYGYIDTKGNMVIEPQYDYASDFNGDYAEVYNETEDGKTPAQIIDKKGNTVKEVSDKIYIEYHNGYWLINHELYDANLKKISGEGVELDYEDNGYYSWTNDSKNIGGIINSTGKVTYTYKFTSDSPYIDIESSDTDGILKDTYCVVRVEENDIDNYALVNCDTGKVIIDYSENPMSIDDGNVVSVGNKDNEYIGYYAYILDDKIAYKYEITSEEQAENVTIKFNEDLGYRYIQIRDRSKDYDEGYFYVDVTTGEVTDERPDTKLTEWGLYTNISEFKCDSGHGLKKGDKEVVPCEYSGFNYFDLDVYKYLSSKGKEYVIARKNNELFDFTYYLINIKDGSIVEEFKTSKIYTGYISTFIVYSDSKTDKYYAYNLMTNKSSEIDYGSLYVDQEFNYIAVRDDYIAKNSKISKYYNMDLELIYTEKNESD